MTEEGQAGTLASMVRGGAGVTALKGQLARMTLSDINGIAAALHVALEREADVFKLLLHAMSLRSIFQREEVEGILHKALREGNKAVVMTIAERMQQEDDWNPFASMLGKESKVLALYNGPLVADREVVDLVGGLVLDYHFGPLPSSGMMDPLPAVLISGSDGDVSHAVGVCLRRGPCMRDRVAKGSRGRLTYILIAAKLRSARIVQMLYNALPVAADGSTQKLSDKQFVDAIDHATWNEAHRLPVMQYLVEMGGPSILEQCSPCFLRRLETVAEVSWVVQTAPDLLTQLCNDREDGQMREALAMICQCSEDLSVFWQQQILDVIDPETIVRTLALVLRPGAVNQWARRGLLWRLKTLLDEVPEAWQGWQGEVLLAAVRDGHYRDIEVLLTVCSASDLVMRDASGNRASDIARKDADFPMELLARLTVVAKNAYT